MKKFYWYNQRGEFIDEMTIEEAQVYQGRVNSEANNADERITLVQGAPVE